MSKLLHSRGFQVLLPLAIGVLMPFLVAFFSQIAIGRSLAEAVSGTFHQAFLVRRQNLSVMTALGLVPFIVLATIIWIYFRKQGWWKSQFLLFGGLVGILITVTPAHYGFWPTYFRSGYMGFPHGLEFLIMPFFALVPMAIGVLIGWAFTRIHWGGGAHGN